MVKRPVVAVVTVAALVAAMSFVWVEVRQDREFRRLIAVGDAAFAEGQTFTAIEAFSGALALKPGTMVAHLKRGEAYLARGEHDAARRDLLRATELDGTAPHPAELLGDVYTAMGRHGEAAAQYQRYLQLDDRAAPIQYKLGAAQLRRGDPAAAADAARQAIALDADLPEAHYLLGLALRAQGDSKGAAEALGRAVTLAPALVAAREELADLHGAVGRTRDRMEQLEAIAALERRPEPLVTIGLTYASMGRIEAALETLARARERYPDARVVRMALGRVWLAAAEAGDRTAAVSAIEALRPIASGADASSETMTLYGRALLLADRASAAERALQEAVERTPIAPDAFTYLAEASRRLGRAAAARDAEQRAERLAPAR